MAGFLKNYLAQNALKNYGLKPIATTEIITEAIAAADTIDEAAADTYC